MVQRVSLISQHSLIVSQSLVVVVIVEGCCCWAASANRQIRRHSSGRVMLLAMELEERLNVALSHARLDISHDVDVGLTRDLIGPSHRIDLLVIFDDT